MEQTKQTKKQFFKNPVIVALVALFCCALWGSATPFIKIGYQLMLPSSSVASTILFAGIRFTLAGIITILIYSIAAKKMLFPKKSSWGSVVKIACFQTIIQYIFFYIGLSNTSGVKGTIASGSGAFFSMLIACLIFKQEKISFRKIFACIIGFAGIILINLNGLDFNMNFTGDAFVLFSAISYAVSSVLMKRYSEDESPVILSGYQFILGGIIMILLGLLMGGSIVVSSINAVLVLLYLACLSAAAYALWGILLQHNPVSKVTIYTFMTPVFGVILSNLMLTEQSNVSPLNLVFTLVLICSGIILLNYKKD